MYAHIGASVHVRRLHDPVVTVTFTVTNNGTVAGTEVSLLLWLSLLDVLTSNFVTDPTIVHFASCSRQERAVQPQGLRQRLPRPRPIRDGVDDALAPRLLDMGRCLSELADCDWSHRHLDRCQQQRLEAAGFNHELISEGAMAIQPS